MKDISGKVAEMGERGGDGRRGGRMRGKKGARRKEKANNLQKVG